VTNPLGIRPRGARLLAAEGTVAGLTTTTHRLQQRLSALEEMQALKFTEFQQVRHCAAGIGILS